LRYWQFSHGKKSTTKEKSQGSRISTRLIKARDHIMKKFYFICLYFLFFIPFGFIYKILQKPIFEENILSDSKEYQNSDEKVMLILKEPKKYKPTLLISLLEKILPKYN
jgi:hypothetical protein